MFLLLLALSAAPTPKELNDAGMKSYRAKELEKAVEQFQKALTIDPDDKDAPSLKERVERAKLRALIHHNLACVQSLLRAKGQVCVTDNYRGVIVEHLRQSVMLDPGRLDRATKDPDLASVRDTLGFQSLLGLSIARDVDLLALLPRVKWWSPGVGAYGSLGELTFKADGTCQLKQRTMSEDGKPPTVTTTNGRWKLSARKLTIDLPGRALAGEVTETGLELDGTPWADSPSECDA
jgi:tetratricopeptide (TPR) repeat protein